MAFDPVTEADQGAERAIRALIEERFPDHSIHGEEYGIKKTDSPFEWVLDPVDGTRAFISGLPTWGTLIALKHEGVPVIGGIGPTLYKRTLPWMDRRCHAERQLLSPPERALHFQPRLFQQQTRICF